MGSRRSGSWLKSFLEAVGFILSRFRLKRSRGDPIHAPGRFTITTLSFKFNKKIFLHKKNIFLLDKNSKVVIVNVPGA